MGPDLPPVPLPRRVPGTTQFPAPAPEDDDTLCGEGFHEFLTAAQAASERQRRARELNEGVHVRDAPPPTGPTDLAHPPATGTQDADRNRAPGLTAAPNGAHEPEDGPDSP